MKSRKALCRRAQSKSEIRSVIHRLSNCDCVNALLPMSIGSLQSFTSAESGAEIRGGAGGLTKFVDALHAERIKSRLITVRVLASRIGLLLA